MGVYRHDSVMPADVLTWLAVRTGGRYIDGTLGGGGHAERILAAAAETEVLGIDRDDEALAAAGQRLEPFGGRVHLRRGNYSEMAARAAEIGWREVDGIVLDLGISSHQIDEPGRGFSHRADGPLDMRMDRRQPVTAATLLNTATEGELARLFVIRRLLDVLSDAKHHAGV
ncbi:MAG: Ribosomal RNA small subunit methyltransferase H [Lentisphaerae bacterium ADurb.BinA184]|nr:MAG: Ribosomal RNA small subunit methyltransferase H [Lentisphaerae bacterium ADurb.BinA184]